MGFYHGLRQSLAALGVLVAPWPSDQASSGLLAKLLTTNPECRVTAKSG